ncbi:5869_t:CDS:1, partial [Dentiscutata heterogama]
EMESISSSIYLKETEPNIILEDEDIQKFEGLPFMIKLTTIQDSRNSACLFFINEKNNEKESSIPSEIKIVDNTIFSAPFTVPPFPGTNSFLIDHLCRYQVYYNNQCVYRIYSKKKFVIHNDRKPLQCFYTP